jgi:hypothetical protein
LFAALFFTACDRTPKGYNSVLKQHGGAHFDSISNPKILADYAALWARDWKGCFQFFCSELDSSDASHTKAGLLCLSLLTAAIELNGSGQVPSEAKAEYAKVFPQAKLRDLLAKHPEYSEWAWPLGSTRYAEDFKLSRAK